MLAKFRQKHLKYGRTGTQKVCRLFGMAQANWYLNAKKIDIPGWYRAHYTTLTCLPPIQLSERIATIRLHDPVITKTPDDLRQFMDRVFGDHHGRQTLARQLFGYSESGWTHIKTLTVLPLGIAMHLDTLNWVAPAALKTVLKNHQIDVSQCQGDL
jgi:hypothetical protein